ncbi:16S rRNA (uracil(1498)-N(3))-methyltransferase [Fulvivirga sp. 29W222]|uniref:Ribosomal RNA small subunit methyltransferase E n=1 Tax=Fulvivirga marina TaxID=2494733 RepID=A0A937FWV2_9BACT|nr:16S rRNA (uracil(1498)-N(3))-methyltransferase [Fulvivirga marina]MBL6445851.1 16S rRNA (uracil(1498)-N(3))-methyltransferase [Fulvivirga marina]
MALFYQPEIPAGVHYLDQEESRHCVKVLRHGTGDIIKILDGKGNIYKAQITTASPKECVFEIIDTTIQDKPPFHIHIAIAPTKNLDRMEWFIEKAVEIGIQEVSFMLCKNSERRILKTERLEKKAVSAMKQSQGSYMPLINELVSYPDFISKTREEQKYIAYVDFSNPAKLYQTASPEGTYCILIGPEGDFTKDELELAIQNGFSKVSLGNSRLRTETAGLAACHILNLINLQ